MRKVGAYLLERRDNVSTDEQRKAEVGRLLDILQEWLKHKGAKELSPDSGTFESRDGEATFRWERAFTQDRSWRLLRLDEVSAEGRRFCTAVSITDTGGIVAVYVSLEAGLVYSTIAPFSPQPRCPKFVRLMLDVDNSWYHGTTKFQKPKKLIGEDAGRKIATEILAADRTLPILLLSEDNGEILIPKLEEKLAYDLAGLANVFVLDHDAAWGITDVLGKPWSCFWGAIRLYWPRANLAQNPYYHPLWTANKLLKYDDSLDKAGERFREQLKHLLMHVSALSVVRPREIDEIRNIAAKQQIIDLQRHAASLDEFRQLAELYAKENDRLRLQNEQLNDELSRTQTLLQNAEEIARLQQPRELEFEPDTAPDNEADLPQDDEIRFYKKTGNNGRYDKMERIADCGHTKWQRGKKGEQAQRGIAHLEGTRNWKNIWHCGTCDGGGVWKVRW